MKFIILTGLMLCLACSGAPTLSVSKSQANESTSGSESSKHPDKLNGESDKAPKQPVTHEAASIDAPSDKIIEEDLLITGENSVENTAPDQQVTPKDEGYFQRDPQMNPMAIGCIVPLTGRAKLVGQAILGGVKQAADNKLKVVVRDSENDPQKAALAVEDLVKNEHVAAIVGPVNGPVALAAAKVAQELRVPLLTLTVKPGTTRNRPFVFRHFSSNKAEIQALVGAAEQSGIRRIALCAPSNGYGRAMGRLLKIEIDRRGLELSAQVTYDPTGKSFTEAASKLAESDFEALLIPDSASRIALMAPALAAAGLWSAPVGNKAMAGGSPSKDKSQIQFLITSTGFSNDLVRRTGRYLQGALFATFFNPLISEQAQLFDEDYRSYHGQEPSYLSAFGHDSVLLIADALASRAGNRPALRRWFAEYSKVENRSPMVTPFNGFDEDGEPVSLPWLLRLDDQQFSVHR